MRPIRISRTVYFASLLDPDPEAVLRGIETNLIWRGSHTVRLTPGEYVFQGPGFARALLPDGGSTTWLVRVGRVSFAVPQRALRVELELHPVPLFLLPLALAAVIVLLPLGVAPRAACLAAGAGVWAGAYHAAWKRYRDWIRNGARQPWHRVKR